MKLCARGGGAGHAIALLMVASCLVLGLAPGTSVAAECGPSGNTYWTFNGVAPIQHAVVGALGIYVVAGTKLSLLDPATGAEINSRDFLTVTLTRPIVFTPRHPVNGASQEVVVAGSNGWVYGLHPSTLATNWFRDTRRPTCASDFISAPPVVQLWESSDSTFRAARSTDVVMVGTSCGCGSTTLSKVFGLNAETGAILWLYNSVGTYQVDAVQGLAVDYARNMVYVTCAKTDPTRTQDTIRGVTTTVGAQRWHYDYGAFATEPVMAAGRLYVVNQAGTLSSLDPYDGASRWSDVVAGSGWQVTQRLVADVPSPSYVALYAVDTGGTIHALIDGCNSHAPVWSYKPAGASFVTAPAVLTASNQVYVGADDGRVYQFRGLDGSGQAYATISAGAASSNPLVVMEGASAPRPRLLAMAGTSLKKLCIPWLPDLGDRAHRLGAPGLDRDPPPALVGFRIPIPGFSKDRHTLSRSGRSGS